MLPASWWQKITNKVKGATEEKIGSDAAGTVYAEGSTAVIKVFDKRSAPPTAETLRNHEMSLHDQVYKALNCPKSLCCNYFIRAEKVDTDKILIAPRGLDMQKFLHAMMKGLGDESPENAFLSVVGTWDKNAEFNKEFNACAAESTTCLCAIMLFMQDLITAVRCLHQQNLVHGDINLRNILIACAEDKPRFRALLADLGASHRTDWLGHFSFSTGSLQCVQPDLFMTEEKFRLYDRHQNGCGTGVAFDAMKNDWWSLILSFRHMFGLLFPDGKTTSAGAQNIQTALVDATETNVDQTINKIWIAVKKSLRNCSGVSDEDKNFLGTRPWRIDVPQLYRTLYPVAGPVAEMAAVAAVGAAVGAAARLGISKFRDPRSRLAKIRNVLANRGRSTKP